jgi:ferredoxin
MKIVFIESDGIKKEIEVPEGISILEAAHANEISLEGACEGSLACSTCHVYISEGWFGKLPKAKEEEEDMLDLAFDLKENSRLGCQIILTKELDGIEVILPQATRNL